MSLPPRPPLEGRGFCLPLFRGLPSTQPAHKGAFSFPGIIFCNAMQVWQNPLDNQSSILLEQYFCDMENRIWKLKSLCSALHRINFDGLRFGGYCVDPGTQRMEDRSMPQKTIYVPHASYRIIVALRHFWERFQRPKSRSSDASIQEMTG